MELLMGRTELQGIGLDPMMQTTNSIPPLDRTPCRQPTMGADLIYVPTWQDLLYANHLD